MFNHQKQLAINYKWLQGVKATINNILQRIKNLENIVLQNWIKNSRQIITDDLIDLYPNTTVTYFTTYPNGINITNVLAFAFEVINDKTVYLPQQLGDFSIEFTNDGILFTLKTNDLSKFIGSGSKIGSTQIEFICTSFSNIK